MNELGLLGSPFGLLVKIADIVQKIVVENGISLKSSSKTRESYVTRAFPRIKSLEAGKCSQTAK